jgi:hypothetical protein
MEQRQFTGRKIKRNHSNALPRYIISYATETRNEPNESRSHYSTDLFVRGSLISCRLDGTTPKAIQPRIVNSPEGFWKEIERLSAPNYTTWVIGHSILYEMLVSKLPEQFEQAKFVIDWPRSKRKREDNNEDDPHSNALVIINNPPTIIACRCVNSGGRVVIVDLLNWFPSSLSDIREALNGDREDWRASIEGYSDLQCPSMDKAGVVLATFLRLIGWSRANDVGMFRYTAASQAMSAYRHRFMSHDILVHDNADIKALERLANIGGRTEVFRFGKFEEKMHQLDVNSLYPSVMQYGEFPIKLERYMKTSRWSSNLPDIEWGKSVAKVWLNTKNPIYPVRMPQGIVYPIGQFDTYLCGEELAHAKASGDLLSVQSWAEYSTGRIFTAWVDYMWELRRVHVLSGDTIYAKLVKLMLNGLYGKFAQRGSKWVGLKDNQDVTPWREWIEVDGRTGTARRYRSFGYEKQEYAGDTELPTTFVAISSFIAAAARCRMNHLRSIAGTKNVYYQGVDGLIVTEAGHHNLDKANEIREGQIGLLRHQLTVDEGEILGYCDYKLGSKVVKSGLAGNAVLLPDSELMQQIQCVGTSLFSPEGCNGVQKVDTLWHRQAMAAKGVMDNAGVVWPYTLNRVQPIDSDIIGSLT